MFGWLQWLQRKAAVEPYVPEISTDKVVSSKQDYTSNPEKKFDMIKICQ